MLSGSSVMRTCKISLNQINVRAISSHDVQLVWALNVKQLHSTINFLNLPPSLLLLLVMLPASSRSALREDLGWLLWMMAVRREGKTRDGEGRWASAAEKWQGACLPPRTNFGFRVFRCSHRRSRKLDESKRERQREMWERNAER